MKEVSFWCTEQYDTAVSRSTAAAAVVHFQVYMYTLMIVIRTSISIDTRYTAVEQNSIIFLYRYCCTCRSPPTACGACMYVVCCLHQTNPKQPVLQQQHEYKQKTIFALLSPLCLILCYMNTMHHNKLLSYTVLVSYYTSCCTALVPHKQL